VARERERSARLVFTVYSESESRTDHKNTSGGDQAVRISTCLERERERREKAFSDEYRYRQLSREVFATSQTTTHTDTVGVIIFPPPEVDSEIAKQYFIISSFTH
jgi:hypothetical protein